MSCIVFVDCYPNLSLTFLHSYIMVLTTNRHCPKHFIFAITFEVYTTMVTSLQMMKLNTWVRISHLPKVTRLGRRQAGLQTQVIWLQNP